jgi:hypothetical protein
MRVNVAIPEAHVKAPVLDAALESVTRLNEQLLAEGHPTFDRAVIRGVKWRPEPPGAEHFDHLATVNRRGWGDCDDLAPYHAASLRHTGEDEGATAVVKRSGPKSWHAVVQRSDGSIDDPSARAGMGPGIRHGVRGAVLPLMYPPPSSAVVGSYIIRPQIAIRPVRGAAQARVDIPWQWRAHLEDKPTPTDYAMTALHTSPVASGAITGADYLDASARALHGAICGGLMLAEAAGFASDEHLAGLEAIAGYLEGLSVEELEEQFGGELAHRAQTVVGSFFSHLNPLKAIKSVTNLALHNPLTSMAANFVPGGRAALDAANAIWSHIPGTAPGGGGGGVPGMPTPSFPGMPSPGGAAPGAVHARRATIIFE